MNFMTLQRPTFEELERRRQLRESLSPQRSTTLQRRESMLSRGLNAILRRQSFMSPQRPQMSQSNTNLRRHDSFFMHSALAKDPDVAPPISMMMTNDNDQDFRSRQHPLHTIVNNNNNSQQTRAGARSNLVRAKSFKYPERVSQIPPAELTRLRSKSQVRAEVAMMSSSEDPVYTSGSGGSNSGSGKSFQRRPPPSGASNSQSSYFDELGYGQAVQWLSREKFFQPPPRVLPNRPSQNNTRPSPRDISEPPPTGPKRRLPLPDIFYYGDRWQEQETRSSRAPVSSLETPEPPPGSSDMSNNNNR